MLLFLLDVSYLLFIIVLKSPAQINVPCDSEEINSRIFFRMFLIALWGEINAEKCGHFILYFALY